jgi:hypothetical protein
MTEPPLVAVTLDNLPALRSTGASYFFLVIQASY